MRSAFRRTLALLLGCLLAAPAPAAVRSGRGAPAGSPATGAPRLPALPPSLPRLPPQNALSPLPAPASPAAALPARQALDRALPAAWAASSAPGEGAKSGAAAPFDGGAGAPVDAGAAAGEEAGGARLASARPGAGSASASAPAPPRPARARPKARLWQKIAAGVLLASLLAGAAYYFAGPRLRPVRPPEPIVETRPARLVWTIDASAAVAARPDAKQPRLDLLLAAAPRATSAALSADGASAVTAHADGSLRLWDLRAGAAGRAAGYPGQLLGATISPDGSRIVTLDADGTVRLIGRADGSLRSIDSRAGAATAVSFSPDARLVAFATAAGRLVVFDAVAGRIAGAYDVQGELLALRAAEDGSTLILTKLAGKVKLWSLKAGQAPVALAERAVPGGALSAAAISADGRRVTLAGTVMGLQGLIALSVGSSKPQLLPAGALGIDVSQVRSVALSRDGSFAAILAADGRLWAWDIDLDETFLVGRAPSGGTAFFTPDGRIGAADSSGGVRLWSLP